MIRARTVRPFDPWRFRGSCQKAEPVNCLEAWDWRLRNAMLFCSEVGPPWPRNPLAWRSGFEGTHLARNQGVRHFLMGLVCRWSDNPIYEANIAPDRVCYWAECFPKATLTNCARPLARM